MLVGAIGESLAQFGALLHDVDRRPEGFLQLLGLSIEKRFSRVRVTDATPEANHLVVAQLPQGPVAIGAAEAGGFPAAAGHLHASHFALFLHMQFVLCLAAATDLLVGSPFAEQPPPDV